MNIMQVQHALRSVPDQALVNYVQHPTADVPQYLALAELQHRKQMRTSMQGQAAQQQMQQSPQQSVAEQETAGVASLPTGDMYDEKHYAQGGMVAFADGGTTSWMDRFNPKYYTDPQGLKQQKIHEMADAQRTEWGRRLAAQEQLGAGGVRGGDAPAGRPLPPVSDQVAPPVDTPKAAPAPAAGLRGLARAQQEAPAPEAVDPYQEFMQPPTTPEAETERVRTAMGVDPNRAAGQERLAAMQERSGRHEQQAPWMALANAGFEMAAGPSQFALQNIAAGGAKGVQMLAAARDRAETTAERQFELANKLAASQRAEDAAIVEHGEKSAAAKAAARTTTGLASLEAKQRMDIHRDDMKIKQKLLEVQGRPPADIQMLNRLQSDPKAMEAYNQMQGARRLGRADTSGLDQDTLIKEHNKLVQYELDRGLKPTPFAEFAARYANTQGGAAAPADEFAGFSLKK